MIVNWDGTKPVPLPNVIVFRTSLNRRSRGVHEYALPAWHEDLVKNHFGGQTPLREWEDVPSVSFCGLAATSGPRLHRRIKMLARRVLLPLGLEIEHNDGIYLRRDAMQSLLKCRLVRTDFLVSNSILRRGVVRCLRVRGRNEYIRNLVGNDYAPAQGAMVISRFGFSRRCLSAEFRF